MRNVENTIFGFTNLLRASSDDNVTQVLKKNTYFQIEKTMDGTEASASCGLFVPCRQKFYSPEELTGFLIKKLVPTAEIQAGCSIGEVFLSAYSALNI